MWTTKDGWPVGVTHAFLWHEDKLWLTFASHRHRAAAIRRDKQGVGKYQFGLLSSIGSEGPALWSNHLQRYRRVP